jgi:uncharacterized membrane protein
VIAQGAGGLLALATVALAALRADWPRLFRRDTVHVHLGTLLGLVLLWSIRADFNGVAVHFLGMGALCLSAGPALALVGGAVVVAGTTALRDAPAANAGLAFLSLVAVPVFVQWAVLLLVRRALPRNPFAWFFVVAFLGGGASFFAGALAGGALGKPLAIDWSEYALITLMLAFGEGTLTGMLLTLGVVYRPAWVATFEDRRDLEQI